MQKTKLALSLAIVSSILTACGGSGGSSGSDAAGVKSESNDPNLKAIAGIYNTSRATDTAYTHIDESGKVTVYEYQGDIEGSSDNCYSIATAVSQINGVLNGLTASYSESEEKYSFTSEGFSLEFSFDAENGMNDFTYNSIFTAKEGALSLKSNNINLLLGGSSALPVDNIQLEDITGLLCE